MKRNLIVLGVVGMLVLGISVPLFAGGYKSLGIGIGALTKGGAFIGQADDWTAIYWNPAGLAQLEGKGAGIEPHYIDIAQHDGNSVKNYEPGLSNYSVMQGDTFMRIYPYYSALGNEPTSFGQTGDTYSGLSPTSSLGGYVTAKDFTLALGMYSPAGLLTDWDDSIVDSLNGAIINANFYSELKVDVYNISIAKQIYPWLYLGAGFNYIQTESESKAKKTYVCAAIPALNYTFDSSGEAHGDGYEGVFGILLKPHPKFSLGGVYRTGDKKMKLYGSAYALHTALGIDERSDYTQIYRFPPSYGMGLAYKPNSKLVLTFDWERTLWDKRVTNEVDYDLAGGTLLTDADLSYEWKNSDTLHLGAEYQLNPKIALRGGMVWDESPVSDGANSITNVVDVDKFLLAFGLGYKLGDYHLDIGYCYGFGSDEIDDVKYKLQMHNVMVGCTYYF